MKSISVIDMELKKNLRATNVPVTEASKQESHNFKALRSVNRAPSARAPFQLSKMAGIVQWRASIPTRRAQS